MILLLKIVEFIFLSLIQAHKLKVKPINLDYVPAKEKLAGQVLDGQRTSYNNCI